MTETKLPIVLILAGSDNHELAATRRPSMAGAPAVAISLGTHAANLWLDAMVTPSKRSHVNHENQPKATLGNEPFILAFLNG